VREPGEDDDIEMIPLGDLLRRQKAARVLKLSRSSDDEEQQEPVDPSVPLFDPARSRDIPTIDLARAVVAGLSADARRDWTLRLIERFGKQATELLDRAFERGDRSSIRLYGDHLRSLRQSWRETKAEGRST
jgi:hypothetical protein